MRLINVYNLELEEFTGSELPPYAILSHTWEEDEVTFAHFYLEHASEKKGFEKIRKSCERAVKDGLRYVWIGTSRDLHDDSGIR